jgi:hypothetical protein
MPVTTILNPNEHPTPGLAHAVGQLLAAGNANLESTPVQRAGYRQQAALTVIRQQVTQLLGGPQGHQKGPVDSAKNELNSYLDRAIDRGYRMDVPAVQKKFADFLLSVVTDGFLGLDTTGTTVGNYTHGGAHSWGGYSGDGR